MSINQLLYIEGLILNGIDKNDLNQLINVKGHYLRQLAGLVFNGTMRINTARCLLIGY